MPAATTLISIDGVLGDQEGEESFAAAKLLTEGLLLYRALTAVGKVVLFTNQTFEQRNRVDYWLKIHGLNDHEDLIFDPWPGDLDRSTELLVAEVRRRGSLTMAIEADPARAARLLHLGVSTLVVARPAYTRSEFRPDSGREVKPWGEVIMELDAQRDIDSEDERTTAGVAGTRFADDGSA
jgi:hypothetical protein